MANELDSLYQVARELRKVRLSVGVLKAGLVLTCPTPETQTSFLKFLENCESALVEADPELNQTQSQIVERVMKQKIPFGRA